MGRVTFHSPATALNAPADRAYAFLSNLDNMARFMPEQVVNWKSEKSSCSFDIKGMAHISLLLGERIENKLVTVDSGPDNPIELQLLFHLVEKTPETCACTVTLHAELGMMLQMMASGPLQNLVDIMAEKLAAAL